MRNDFLSASAIIVKGSGFVTDIFLSDTATGGKLILYDGRNDKGKVIFTGSVGDNLSVSVNFSTYPHFENGLYAVLSGTAPTCNVGHRPA